jgi:DNA-binding PadR family transcriptional regulator
MTNAELAILSLIAESPKYGYEIERIIEARGMRNWTEIGFSSIYYLLNKLEKETLIKSKLKQPKGRGPARKVYTITSEGRAVHIKAALEALGPPQSESAPFLLGLSNFPALPKDEVIKAVNKYIETLNLRLEHIERQVEVQTPLPPFVESMFDYSRTLLKAERKWMYKFINDMEVGNV